MEEPGDVDAFELNFALTRLLKNVANEPRHIKAASELCLSHPSNAAMLFDCVKDLLKEDAKGRKCLVRLLQCLCVETAYKRMILDCFREILEICNIKVGDASVRSTAKVPQQSSL